MTIEPTQSEAATTEEPAPPTEQPSPLPPTPTVTVAAGGVFLGAQPSQVVDANTLPCTEGQTLFAIDFDEAGQAGDLNAFPPIARGLMTFEERWLVIGPMQNDGRMIVPLQLPQHPLHPTAIAVVAWRAGDGPFSILANAGEPGMESYRLEVNSQGRVTISRGTTVLAEESGLTPLSGGEPHRIEFYTNNGELRGIIDGEVVIEAQDADPLPPRDVQLFTGPVPISIDSLLVCGR